MDKISMEVMNTADVVAPILEPDLVSPDNPSMKRIRSARRQSVYRRIRPGVSTARAMTSY